VTASALWPREVWAEAVWKSDLPPTQKLVALAYADHARDRDVAWASYDRLMRRTGLSRDTVARCMKALVKADWLLPVRAAGQHRSARYGLTTPSQQSDGLTTGDSQQSDGAAQQSDGAAQQSDGAPPTELPTELPTSPNPVEEDVTATTNTTATAEDTGRALLAAVPASSLTVKAREHLATCLTAGWPPDALVHAVASPSWAGVQWPKAVLATRLQECAQQTPPTPAAARPPWCGDCHQGTRMAGEDAPRRCPACHPMALPTGAP
jgi:hypothetical protein